MTRPQDVGDNKNYYADSDVGFDSEGYILVPGDDNSSDGDRFLKKAPSGGGGTFMGVNHMSSYNYDGTVVETGEPVATIQEGEAMVLCDGGTTYNVGDTIYDGGDSDGVGTGSSGGTEVGTVMEQVDDSGGATSDPVLVPVNITGRV